MSENLIHYKPTKEQYAKFDRINSKTDEEQDKECLYFNDCSICPFAIHQYLYSTTKHTCVQGMSKRQFEIAMDNADCEF
jgi:hypothetical protein